MENKAITVSVFNNYINNIISAEELLVNISIVGEICDYSVRNNIAYFSIKDSGAILSCVCFLQPVFNKIKNGMQATIVGSPQFYVKGGRFNFKVVNFCEFGKGNAYLKLLELKEKLEKKGYFNLEHKKALPKYAFNIGVLTSESGAVLQDIKSVAFRRNPFVKIMLCSSGVQGQNAENEIVKAIKLLDKANCDVIIIARGGGSDEDLNVFNSEKIADEIYNAKTPIVSAIGHQTNFTICDFVSDLRVETPSVAAEIAIYDFISLKNQFYKSFVASFENVSKQIQIKRQKLESIYSKMLNLTLSNIQQFDSNLKLANEKLNKLNPNEILKRGYSIISKDNKLIDFKTIKLNDEIKIKTVDGELFARITKKGE